MPQCTRLRLWPTMISQTLLPAQNRNDCDPTAMASPSEFGRSRREIGAKFGAGIDELKAMIECGELDRVSARAVIQIARGELDSRELKQLLPQKRIRIRSGSDDIGTEAVASPQIGDWLGRYRLGDVIHRGRNAVVFLSRHPELGIAVAVKVAISERGCEQLRTEIEVLAGITHSNILRLWDAAPSVDCPYMVTEYCDGGTVLDRLASDGWNYVHLRKLMIESLLALRALDCTGRIHGDIKPSNILLTAAGETRLADFGLASCPPEKAKSCANPELLSVQGSWPYLAPECFHATGDQRSDIYSLGLTVYHLHTGEIPVNASTREECEIQHRTLRIDPLHWSVAGVSRRESELLIRMTATDPERRPDDYDRLLAEWTALPTPANCEFNQ